MKNINQTKEETEIEKGKKTKTEVIEVREEIEEIEVIEEIEEKEEKEEIEVIEVREKRIEEIEVIEKEIEIGIGIGTGIEKGILITIEINNKIVLFNKILVVRFLNTQPFNIKQHKFNKCSFSCNNNILCSSRFNLGF
jgi:hypothetical protein